MSQQGITNQKLKSTYLLLLVILLGFALRTYKLGEQSLWYDETVSAFLAGQPVPALMTHTARDIHPPGYYLLLHFWSRWVGNSEYALAFFSLIFGQLLIPATYRLAGSLTRRQPVAMWAALFVAISPYNIWYSQEVRMYSLAAFLGVTATWCALQALRRSSRQARWFWVGYWLCASIGLYVLYYFVFLLIVINLFFLINILFYKQGLRNHEIDFANSDSGDSSYYALGVLRLAPFTLGVTYASPNKINRMTLRTFLIINLLILITYLPWLPLAWRQVTTPPVPPWRTPDRFGAVLLESWAALSLGQSVDPTTIWPILLLILALFLLGVYSQKSFSLFGTLLLVFYTFGPLLLIQLFSLITPLYHIRYIFTYSPAFYVVIGLGVVYLTTRINFWVSLLATLPLIAASFFFLYHFHFDPRYRADDYRAAVAFIEHHWQPGDVILTNAGYIYPAFLYYTTFTELERQRLVPYHPPQTPTHPLLLQGGTLDGSPQLGWGDPRSDFYAMSQSDTAAALTALSTDYYRLWLLRAYDTVTDPTAFMRTWLADHATLIEDHPFSGESNIRVQGFLLKKSPPLDGEIVYFADGMALMGWNLPAQTWSAGQDVPLKLGWLSTTPPSVDYKMSLKLWAESGALAAQGQDTWPVGTFYRATTWPLQQTIYQPAQIFLPPNLPPGRYWLNVELYHPDTSQPLPRLDGADPVVTLGSVEVVNK